MIDWTQHKGKTQAGGRGLHGRDARAYTFGGLHGRDARAYTLRGLHGDARAYTFRGLHGDARAYTFRDLHGRDARAYTVRDLHGDARAYTFSGMLSIRRVLPTNAAKATNAPCETLSTDSRVSGLTISK